MQAAQRPQSPTPTPQAAEAPRAAPVAPQPHQPSWEQRTHQELTRRAKEAEQARGAARAAQLDREQVRALEDAHSAAVRELLRLEVAQRGLPPGLSQAQRDSSLQESMSARLELDTRKEGEVHGRVRKLGRPNPDSR